MTRSARAADSLMADDDPLPVVPDRRVPVDAHAQGREPPAQPGRVGVHQVAEQHLAADGNYLRAPYLFLSHGWYSTISCMSDRTALLNRADAFARARLSDNRYGHTVRVADAAERLATLHGLDARRARLAALLHDAAREPR